MICVSLRVYLFLFKRLCVEWWKKVCSFYSSLGSHHIASAPLAKYTRSSLPTLRFALVNFFCATFKAIQTRFAASPLRFFIFLYCSSISLCLFPCIIYIYFRYLKLHHCNTQIAPFLFCDSIPHAVTLSDIYFITMSRSCVNLYCV